MANEKPPAKALAGGHRKRPKSAIDATPAAKTQGLFCREERKPIAWIGLVGTGLPFAIALLLSTRLKLGALMGTAQNQIALVLVIGIGTAVTSIPVISRIFHDLRILHTRFAKLILGVAVMEDVVLWALLAVATALAESKALPTYVIAQRIALTLITSSRGLCSFRAWHAVCTKRAGTCLSAIRLRHI